MIKTKFYLNNKLIVSPSNYQELAIELNFDKDDPNFRGEVSTNRWQLGLGDLNDDEDGTKTALSHIDGGLTGSVGVFEGIPFRIELENEPEQPKVLFDGYLDLSTADVTCSTINANAIESNGIDWLNEVVDSFDFEFLFENEDIQEGQGLITRNDFVSIPYILSDVPDYKEALMISISAFVVVSELLDQIQSLVEQPVGALFANAGDILTFVLRIISIIILVVSIVALIVQIIRALVQVAKFHAGMYLFTLCQRGAEYLGLEFKSESILEATDWRNVALLPQKYEQKNNDKGIEDRVENFSNAVIGYLTATDVDGLGFYKGTYGNLLRDLKEMFNAKLIFKDGVLRLEKLDYFDSSPAYVLEDVDRTNVPYRFNSEDFISNYGISFVPDDNDKQTLDKWNGSKVIVTARPNVINVKSNLIARNERKVNIPFARGRRNTRVTFVQKMINEYINFIKPIIQNNDRLIQLAQLSVNAITRKAKKFLRAIRLVVDRKTDALVMATDFVSTPKLVMMQYDYENWQDKILVRLSPKNDQVLDARNIYNNFHSVNSFIGQRDNNGQLTGKHNQYKEYSLDEIPFCIEDYVKIRANNRILDADGITPAEVISLKWNVYKQTASITFRVNERYTTNLTETLIDSDGR
jgi:hypothetical protein